jgi:hypothetical protein
VATQVILENNLVKKFVLLSRVGDKAIRDQLEIDDKWDVHLAYDDEMEALGDFFFLRRSGHLREYLLIARLQRQVFKDLPWALTDDDLNDVI